MRYKLIKEYPGSPALGTIITEYHEGFRILNNNGVAVGYVETEEVHNWPAYWEQIGPLKKNWFMAYLEDYLSGRKWRHHDFNS